MSDIERVAKLTARETVQETFLALGVDISTPAGVTSTQKDFAFVRGSRYALRRAGIAALTALAGLGATGIGWAIWGAIQGARAAAGQ